jgi:hypothetical protein
MEGLEELFASLTKRKNEFGNADGLMTVEEICIKVGHAPEWVRTKLRLLEAAGRLVIGKKRIRALDGRPMMVNAYGIKMLAPKPSPKKSK